MATITHGGYAQECPEGIHQHEYTGGGHPGCGGYVEALEIESIHGPRFVMQEYLDDCNHPHMFRWREFSTAGELLEAWKQVWSLARSGDGFCEWNHRPFWEVVPYNDAEVAGK